LELHPPRIFVFLNFSSPWGVIYAYTPEVYPTTLRTTGVGLCAFFTRLAGTITPLFGTTLLSYGFMYPFISYGIALLIAGICSLLLPIETLNRELQDEVTADAGLNSKQIKEKHNLGKESMTPLIDK
jgi:MFS family permease